MSENAVKSARRGFEVLEYFEVARGPLALKQVCDELGYPPSSGAAIMKSLVMLGYLEYDRPSRTYLPTMRIAALGGWVRTELFDGMNVLDFMESLRRETGESVMLAAQSDLHSQYVHVVHSRPVLSRVIAPGMLRPLAQASLGHLLLGQHSDAAIERIVRRIDVARPAGAAKIDLQALLDRVRLARARGYTVARDVFIEDTGMIGMLLPETRFGRRFAIGLGGPAGWLRETETSLVPWLRDAVRRFTETVH